MQKILCSAIFVLLYSFQSYAVEKIDLSGKQSVIENKYLAHLGEMSKELCTPGTYEKAGRLYKKYTGNGLYVPLKKDESVDLDAVKNGLPLLAKKRDWLRSLRNDYKKTKHFKKEYRKLSKLKKDFLVLHKENYKQYKGQKNNLKSLTSKFNSELISFLENEIQIFHPFGFPVDYFNLRKTYDEIKSKDKSLANKIYFKRKIYEDGVVNPKSGRKDTSFRAMISTVYLRLLKFDDEFYSEELRYDIESLLEFIRNSLLRGVSYHKQGVSKWQNKIQEDINFYYKMINSKKSQDFLKEYQTNRKRARKALRDFTYSKIAKVYKFWTDKEVLYRLLFSIETILFHEVGPLDNDFGSERRAIIQVVLNRLRNDSYNDIDPVEDLYPFLKVEGVNNFEKYKWLNVLFKKGQFSFTYFFIPASKGIFCPDASRSARRLRKQNLKFAMEVLKFPISVFEATRYFSRSSMVGRIDMAKLWREYKKWPELPGPEIKNQKKYKRLLEKKKLRFIGTLKTEKGLYEIWSHKRGKVLYGVEESKFFIYRDPHLFTYFYKFKDY